MCVPKEQFKAAITVSENIRAITSIYDVINLERITYLWTLTVFLNFFSLSSICSYNRKLIFRGEKLLKNQPDSRFPSTMQHTDSVSSKLANLVEAFSS